MAEHRHHWFWQGNKANPKAGLHRLFRSNSGFPGSPATGQITNKLVSETFWPDSLDRESTKAARILHSFCKHGMYQDEVRDPANHTTQKQKMWSKIPQDVIANAKGLVIFTVMRTGLWVSGAGGSGVVVARTPRGSWSWPIAIELHTAELGFLVGVDIYDCVLVLNTAEAVESFSKSRCIIGGDLYATPGPLGVGWFFDKDTRTRQAPIFSYLRSRGYYAAVQLDHAVVVPRADENQQFYQMPNLSPKDIFAGDHIHRPASCLTLLETLKASEGTAEVDENLLPTGPPPSDFEVVEEGHAFGIPDKEDPDPYGVLALEKQGLLIREAGTKTSPTLESFEFNPSITSPVYAKYNRRSADGSNLSVRSSWRRSVVSTGDRNDASSVISRDTDQDSVSPASPGLTPNSRTVQFGESDNRPNGASRNLTNGHQAVSGEASVGRQNSFAGRLQRSNSRQQTIYEDADEGKSSSLGARLETFADTSIMDNMVDTLQGKEKKSHPQAPAAPLPPSDNNGEDKAQQQEAPNINTGQPEKPGDDDLSPGHGIDEGEKRSGEPLVTDTNRLDESDIHVESPDHNAHKEPESSAKPLAIDTNLAKESVADDELSIHDSDLDDNESPVEIHDVVFQGGGASTVYHQGVSSVTLPKPRIVTVAKLPPPVVPIRNPGRVPGLSDNQSMDEGQQSDSPAQNDLSKAEEMPPREISPPDTPPPPKVSETNTPADPTLKPYDDPVSPIDSLSSSSLEYHEPDSSSRPAEDENQKPEMKTTTLMDIRKGMSAASPSPEASSPEESRVGYFS